MPARKPLNINYAYQKAVSYSQYSTYSQCQYRWYLNYVKKEDIRTNWSNGEPAQQ